MGITVITNWLNVLSALRRKTLGLFRFISQRPVLRNRSGDIV
jgi:hypothetical protein